MVGLFVLANARTARVAFRGAGPRGETRCALAALRSDSRREFEVHVELGTLRVRAGPAPLRRRSAQKSPPPGTPCRCRQRWLIEPATRAPVVLESANGLKNWQYTVAMARTANPNSATAQFFINVVDNAGLNAPAPDGYGYTVFGKVVQGMDTVDKIRNAATGNQGGHQNVPKTPITITQATLEK